MTSAAGQLKFPSECNFFHLSFSIVRPRGHAIKWQVSYVPISFERRQFCRCMMGRVVRKLSQRKHCLSLLLDLSKHTTEKCPMHRNVNDVMTSECCRRKGLGFRLQTFNQQGLISLIRSGMSLCRPHYLGTVIPLPTSRYQTSPCQTHKSQLCTSLALLLTYQTAPLNHKARRQPQRARHIWARHAHSRRPQTCGTPTISSTGRHPAGAKNRYA